MTNRHQIWQTFCQFWSIFVSNSHHGAEVCPLWRSKYYIQMSQSCWIYTLQRWVPKWRQQFFTNDNHLVFMFNNNHKNIFTHYKWLSRTSYIISLSPAWKIHLNLVKINLWDFQIHWGKLLHTAVSFKTWYNWTILIGIIKTEHVLN